MSGVCGGTEHFAALRSLSQKMLLKHINLGHLDDEGEGNWWHGFGNPLTDWITFPMAIPLFPTIHNPSYPMN